MDTTVLASLLGGSVDISPMTMARAYSAFANRGEMCEPRALERVVDYTGKEYDIPETSCERVISEDVADGVNFALNQTLVRGSGWQREIGLLKTIPGFGDIVAWAWIAEIGPAPHQWFASHRKLASWVSLAPGSNVSAGKRKYGRTGDAGTCIKPMPIQAAWAATQVRGTAAGPV